MSCSAILLITSAGRSEQRPCLCPSVDGRLPVLLTVRSHRTGSHKGQVSFPGGHLDPHETAEEAAARELTEETGLTDQVQILGSWHPTRAVTGTMVDPVVGWLDRDFTTEEIDNLTVSEEVSHCFAPTIKQLTAPGACVMETLEVRSTT